MSRRSLGEGCGVGSATFLFRVLLVRRFPISLKLIRLVINASRFDKAPLARIQLPQRVHLGCCGSWVPTGNWNAAFSTLELWPRNAEVDDLIENVNVELDRDKRQAMWRCLHEIFVVSTRTLTLPAHNPATVFAPP